MRSADELLREAMSRVRGNLSSLFQKTAAATLAWLIARHVAGHPDPFFAPIAAVIGLNAILGQRGANSLRLVLGVLVGISVGELTLLSLGSTYPTLALATFVAMAIATALHGAPVVVAQAATAAILTLVTGDASVGAYRLVDALIGVGVAMTFSQLLFSPEPIALLHRAESLALREMAKGLDLTAQALEREDPELVERALDGLRALRDKLGSLAQTRLKSVAVARHSAIWRTRIKPLVIERQRAGQLDLLGGSCLSLSRISMLPGMTGRASLAPRVRELSAILAELAEEPGPREARLRSAERARALARDALAAGASTDEPLGVALFLVRAVASDVMLFAGVSEGVDELRSTPADE